MHAASHYICCYLPMCQLYHNISIQRQSTQWQGQVETNVLHSGPATIFPWPATNRLNCTHRTSVPQGFQVQPTNRSRVCLVRDTSRVRCLSHRPCTGTAITHATQTSSRYLPSHAPSACPLPTYDHLQQAHQLTHALLAKADTLAPNPTSAPTRCAPVLPSHAFPRPCLCGPLLPPPANTQPVNPPP